MFSLAEEKAFAIEIAAQLIKSIPPHLMAERRQLLSASRITRMLEQIYEKARRRQATKKLGFLRKAILAHHFKWELRSNGYPDDFVDLAVEGLIVELSKKSIVSAS